VLERYNSNNGMVGVDGYDTIRFDLVVELAKKGMDSITRTESIV
jgi:hypothetical protein